MIPHDIAKVNAKLPAFTAPADSEAVALAKVYRLLRELAQRRAKRTQVEPAEPDRLPYDSGEAQ